MQSNSNKKAVGKSSAAFERSIGRVVLNLIDGESVRLVDINTPERAARRLLDSLTDLRLVRTHGGLAPKAKYFHESQRLKSTVEKAEIARKAVSKLDPVSSVAAFTGTLVAKVVQEMHHQNIAPVVITNSVAVLDSVPQAPQVHLVAGQYDANIHGLVGQDAIDSFARRSYGQGLVGLSGLQVDDNNDVHLYVRHPAEVPVLQAMLNHVKDRVVIVANIQKFGRTDSWRFASLRELLTRVRVVLVTNAADEWRRELGSEYPRAKQTSDKLVSLQREAFELAIASRGR